MVQRRGCQLLVGPQVTRLSEVEPCEDGARPVTGSPSIGPPEPVFLFARCKPSEVEPCEDGARPVTGSPFIGPPEPFFLFARCKPKE